MHVTLGCGCVRFERDHPSRLLRTNRFLPVCADGKLAVAKATMAARSGNRRREWQAFKAQCEHFGFTGFAKTLEDS
jgi:hypothetical protein